MQFFPFLFSLLNFQLFFSSFTAYYYNIFLGSVVAILPFHISNGLFIRIEGLKYIWFKIEEQVTVPLKGMCMTHATKILMVFVSITKCKFRDCKT